jgi:serine/threonine protein kinase
MSKGTTTQAKTTMSGRGKQGYRAPELLLDSQQSYNKKVDIWSLGCILYELSVGTKPFSTDWATLQFAQERSVITVNIVGGSGTVCEHLQTLICDMLQHDFRDRPSITMIREALRGLRLETSRTTPDSPLPISGIHTSPSQDLAISEIRNSMSELRFDLVQEGMAQIPLSTDISQEIENRRTTIAWLSHLNFRAIHNRYVETHQEGTGQWLFQNPIFNDWLEGNTKTLWCHGIRMLPFINATCLRVILILF